MGPPELPGGNVESIDLSELGSQYASMGPPELPGGNWGSEPLPLHLSVSASMGPPELPGGNQVPRRYHFLAPMSLQWGRRNYPAETRAEDDSASTRPLRFNGAAGITRRKRARRMIRRLRDLYASMGPPELPGGNFLLPLFCLLNFLGFNGAAGITRRKHHPHPVEVQNAQPASMGPPELPGGNPYPPPGMSFR